MFDCTYRPRNSSKCSEPLKLLCCELVDKHEVNAEWLYPSHISRSPELIMEAIELAKRGSFVDIDTVDEDLPEQLAYYLENGGPPDKLTV